MIKAIVFDVFGVLAEDGWSPFKRQYIAGRPDVLRAVAKLGKEVDEGKRTFDDMIRETAHLVGVGEAEVRNAVEHRVPNEELFDYIEKELLHKYDIGMLSNASYNVLDLLFTREQVALFDATALSYEVGLVKPDKKMYQVIAKRLGVNMGEMLVVDDQARHCAGALNAGTQALQYESVAQLRSDLETSLLS